MCRLIPGSQKHLTENDRIEIEKGLDACETFRCIAARPGKDPSTISKEIRLHRFFKPHNTFNDPADKCAKFDECRLRHVCDRYAPGCNRQCRRCGRCNAHCKDFVPGSYACTELDRAPFVCNGCPSKTQCRMDKYFYKGCPAHKEYLAILVQSRVGLNISETGMAVIDAVIAPLAAHGRSPCMILRSHPEPGISEKTLYNYINSGALSVKKSRSV